MAIFKRSKGKNADRTNENNNDDSASSVGPEKKPFTARKPANTAFKQQRLKAWQPILTPKTVLPTFFLIGIIFAPIGAVLYYYATKVTEFTLDYTECQFKAGAEPSTMPTSKYSYQTSVPIATSPQWQYVADADAPNGSACVLYFDVPLDLDPTVLMYYKMTNYYQNHRRYVKSIDTDQLLGNVRSPKDLQDGQCKPLGRIGNQGVYPCGLIANSMFNDTFFSPRLLNPSGSTSNTNAAAVKRQTTNPSAFDPNQGQEYLMAEKGIIWPGEKEKYKRTKQDVSELTPPPYWRGNYTKNAPYSFPNGYTADNIYDPSEDEHFMVWMRVAGLPTFRKLYMRNDQDVMRSGRYMLTIYDNYPVDMFHGTKSVVFSTVTWVGGRSIFLGAAFIATAALCVFLGLVFTARHLIRPRKLGDLSLLSWNE